MNTKTSRNSIGNRRTMMARYQESANHVEKGQHRYLHDSFTTTSPLYNSSSQVIDPKEEFSLVPAEFSSPPISSQKTLQEHQKPNHLSRLRQAGIFDEESPTSVLELNASTLWQEHLHRLLHESSGDMEKLVVVPDNARLLPPSYQSTPKRAGRPLLSTSPVLSSSKYRACRWNSEVSSVSTSGNLKPTKPSTAMSSSSASVSSSSSSSLSASSRLPPPPFLGTSPEASYPRPSSVSSSDTQPVLPSRSYQLDDSDHCELPSVTRARRRNRGRRLRRHTSDSVLARPERKDSESGEDTSEEFGLMERL